MPQTGNIHRYVLKVQGRIPYQAEPIPYDKTTGTRFEVYQSAEDKMWYWTLYLTHFGAAARSARGYKTRQTAEGTIRTAFKAMNWVVEK